MSRTRFALIFLLFAACVAPGGWLAPASPTLAWAGEDTVADEAGEDAEDAAEEAAEAAAEDAADAAEEAAEDAAQAAEDAAEEAAEAAAEDAADEAADQAEQAAEDAADEAADQAEDAADEAAQAAEEQAEAAADEAAQEAEDAAEDAADQAQDAAEDAAEEAADAAEDAAEEASEQAEDAADDAASEAEDAAEDAADEAEDAAEDAADDAEDSAEDTAEDARDTEEDAADEREDDRDADDDAGNGDDDDDADGDTDEDSNTGREGRHGSQADSGGRRGIAGDTEVFAGQGQDADGNAISLGEWLVLATPADVRALERLGYLTRSLEPLQGLGRVLARMEAPASFDLETAQAAIRRAAPAAQADFNHLYQVESDGAGTPPARGEAPQALYPLLEGTSGEGLRIGIIDTAADLQHPALRTAHIQARDFVSVEATRPAGHGTSVASILVGQTPADRGLLPEAEIYLAAVFFVTPRGDTSASTLSLVRALDWMAGNRVPVVNMSLAGPRNDILESAIARARELGTAVVAAAGNRGPGAAPLYPAGYPAVVAVTAIDTARHVYRLANRGSHLDFAAPGVNVLHAAAGGSGYQTSSGTSMAAPFVTAVIAASCRRMLPVAACLLNLQTSAMDIGTPGFDPVFGYGLIRPLRS